MELIKNNPHRLLGILVGTSPKVILGRVNNLKIYLSAEEEIPEEELPYGFDRIGKIVRTLDTLNSANSKLNIASEKILNSIFWFYEGSKVGDKDAFESMRDGDHENASEVWQSIIGEKDINASNSSAFHNLSILKINSAFKSSRVFIKVLEEGVQMQLKFLDSNYSDIFFSSFVDNFESKDVAKYQLIFLKAIQEELDKYDSFSSDKVIELVANINFKAKDEFLKESIQKPIKLIEGLISETKKRRNENVSDAEIYGMELYENSIDLMSQVKNILGKTNLKFKSISDKLADEILQCGIDFFNEFKEEEFVNPSENSMQLFIYANELAQGDLIQQRVNENIEVLQDWIDNADERANQKLIKDDIEFIVGKLGQYENHAESISKAKDLVDSCLPRILNIRSSLGINDEFYVNISTAIANHAQGTLVECVNKEVNLSQYSATVVLAGIPPASLIIMVEEALNLTFKIGLLDMNANFKVHYKKNLEGLKKLANQVGVSTLTPKEKVQKELTAAQTKLKEIENSTPLGSFIVSATNELDAIKQWQFLRSQETKDRQIEEKTKEINQLKVESSKEKSALILAQKNKIKSLKLKVDQTNY